MLRSINGTAIASDGTNVNITHVVVKGSSQWIVGPNGTTKCDTIHTNGNYLKMPYDSRTALQTFEFHSYMTHEISFKKEGYSSFQAKLFCATVDLNDSENQTPWSELKKIIDKVHKHVYGHASISDFKILLERNNLRNEEVEKYLNRGIKSITSCNNTSEPERTCKA